jgi:hypothetical protein
MAFCSPLSMAEFIIYRTGRPSGNSLERLRLGPLQSPTPSSVSVCHPLLLCLSIVSGFMPRINSRIKSIAIAKEWRSQETGSLRVVSACTKLTKSWSKFLGCLNSSKSTSSRDLTPLTCLQMTFDLSYLTAPNRPVRIDMPQSTQGENKEQALRLAVSKPSHVNKNTINGHWTVHQHRKGTGHVSIGD